MIFQARMTSSTSEPSTDRIHLTVVDTATEEPEGAWDHDWNVEVDPDGERTAEMVLSVHGWRLQGRWRSSEAGSGIVAVVPAFQVPQDLAGAVFAADIAADGDSNDDEIDRLREALELAMSTLAGLPVTELRDYSTTDDDARVLDMTPADGFDSVNIVDFHGVRTSLNTTPEGAIVVYVDTEFQPELDGSTIRLNLNGDPLYGYNADPDQAADVVYEQV